MWTILFVIWFDAYGSSAQKGISTITIGQFNDLRTCQVIAKQITQDDFIATPSASKSARCVQIKDRP